MQHLGVSCAVRRLFKSLGFKGLNDAVITLSKADHKMRPPSYTYCATPYKRILTAMMTKGL